MAMYRMHPMRWIMMGVGSLFLILGSIWLFTGFSRPFYPGGYYGMPMMGGWGGGWMIGAMIFGFIFVCLLVMMAFRFAAWGPRSHRMGYGMSGSPDAEEILRQRYARGEVTSEQYDQILHALREGRN